MCTQGTFAEIYQKSNLKKHDEFDSFTESIYSQTDQLVKNNQQQYMIVWGCFSVNQDTQQAQKFIVQQFPFLKNRIIQFTESLIFRFVTVNLSHKNILFLMSGSFATDKLDGVTNLEWLDDQIRQQKVHSKAIILFTGYKQISKHNWTIENLQSKFKYVTQLTVEYDQLVHAFDKMINNRVYQSFVQNKSLDFYFGSYVKNVLRLFQCHENRSFPEFDFSKEQKNWKKVVEYSKIAEIKYPLDFSMKDNHIQNLKALCDKCSLYNKQQYSKEQLIENVLNLYTKETDLYKIINYSMNTMNLILYKHLKNMYQLFSKCLFEYNDKFNKSEQTLYRGCCVSQYQYDTLYQEYLYNQNIGISTYICFPQFLSTTLYEKNAKQFQDLRSIQVQKQEDSRLNINQHYSQESFRYLKSGEFSHKYKLLILINTKMDYKNKFRPKYLKKISHFQEEEEVLFQPFQTFRIDQMQKGNQIKDSKMNMTLFYMC